MAPIGLLTKLIAAPALAPAKSAAWAIRQVHDAAYKELYDPESIKRQLIELERQLEAGEIDEETFEELELALLTRLRDASRRDED
ncbi:MAG: gas vesicle protein GvpG [Parvularculaceae bacterium]